MLRADLLPEYSLERSPFYRLFSQNRLAALLGISVEELATLRAGDHYRHFIDTSGSKPRPIQEPKPRLKTLQVRIKNLMARIETPPWVFSGKRGFSYVDNAKQHAANGNILNLDVASFYASSRRSFVSKMFRHTFKTSKQVATILSDLLCCGEFIPTGGPASQIIAFWTYRATFERIHSLALQYGCEFSLYVDDMAFSSSNPISSILAHQVSRELLRVSLSLKTEKTKETLLKENCRITGVMLMGDGRMAIPNTLQRRVFETVSGRKLENLSAREISSLEGTIAACQQIEAGKFNSLKGRLKALRRARTC